MPSLPSAVTQCPADGCTGTATCSRSLGEIQAILRDPATSFWLCQAYAELQQRDPLDALQDAQLLHQAMCARYRALPQ